MGSPTEILWKELLEQLGELPHFTVLSSKASKNIQFMKKMDFADNFTDAAKIQRGFNCGDIQIDWMYAWLQRQNRFFELRPKMLPIGDDGCGNFIYIYDISQPNSPILYMSHDPAVLMVIANSMEQFLSHILGIVKKTSNQRELFSNFMDDARLSESAMKIWKEGSYNGVDNNLGFHFQKISDDKVHANFAKAKPHSGISLAFFGKYTEIYYTNIKEVVVIEKMEVDGVKKLNKKDKRAWILLAILLPLSYVLLGLIKLPTAQRIAIILSTFLLAPWFFDFIRFIRKSGPRL